MRRNPSETRPGIAIVMTALLVVGSTMLPVGAAYIPERIIPEDITIPERVELFPSVSATEYKVIESDTHCKGKYAVSTSSTTSAKKWNIGVASSTKGSQKSETTIDWSYECRAAASSTITGEGGVYRVVGFEAEKVSTFEILGYEFETVEAYDTGAACKYSLNFQCSVTHSVRFGSGGEQTGQGNYPREVCLTLKPITAYNRSDTSFLPDAGIVTLPDMTETTTPLGASGSVCVEISWEKVSTLEIALEHEGLLETLLGR